MKRLLPLIIYSLQCFAVAEATQASNLTPTNAIVARIELAQTNDFLLGAPVDLKIIVRNSSTNPITILTPSFARFAYKTLTVSIRAPSESEFLAVDSPNVYLGAMKSMRQPKTVPVTSLLPGQSAEFPFTLDYEFPTVQRRRWLFPVPGIYSIKAEFFLLLRPALGEEFVAVDSQKIGMETTAVAITVKQPETQIDQQAFVAARGLAHDFLLYAPDQFYAEAYPKAVAEIEWFVSSHRNSKYAAMGRLMMLHEKASRAALSGDKTGLQKTVDEAQALLNGGKLFPSLQAKAKKLISTTKEEIARTED